MEENQHTCLKGWSRTLRNGSWYRGNPVSWAVYRGDYDVKIVDQFEFEKLVDRCDEELTPLCKNLIHAGLL